MAENTEPLALVVDDQDDILEIVSLTLKFDGWRVATARNGREALEAVRRETPELILADLMMPEMTGIEFCRKLIDDLKLAHVPVLMISGVNENAKILQDFWDMPLRHHNFLRKPFGTDELLAAVKTVLPAGAGPAKPAPSPAEAKPATEPAPAPKPAAPAPAPARPAVLPFRPEAGRGYRILVVDDDPDIRAVLKTTLGMFHVVEEAANGMEGVEMVDHFGPDIIISDINMPRMNGLEAAAAIRHHPAYGGVPIFFLTGETDTNLPRKAFDVGGNLYLRKPVDPIQLLKFIDHFLKETGLQPGQLHRMQAAATAKPAAPAQPAPSAPAPAPAPAAPQTVRVLTIDGELDHHGQIRELLARYVTGGHAELLFADDMAQALGNLARWEPDLIFYNPRTPRGLDGVAFGQTLKLRKLAQPPELAFIGERFFDSEVDYSRTFCNRAPIRLDGAAAEAAQRLGEAVVAARARIKPKRMSYAQIRAEEAERLSRLSANSARETKEREVFRKKYAALQEFIDHEIV